ncbi:hypothetical protein B0E53_06665 [Micromonospora sp. MH33]|nr:hypothetical protein B0E53_06665 [Micromonospora sp. MH33]
MAAEAARTLAAEAYAAVEALRPALGGDGVAPVQGRDEVPTPVPAPAAVSGARWRPARAG